MELYLSMFEQYSPHTEWKVTRVKKMSQINKRSFSQHNSSSKAAKYLLQYQATAAR